MRVSRPVPFLTRVPAVEVPMIEAIVVLPFPATVRPKPVPVMVPTLDSVRVPASDWMVEDAPRLTKPP